MRYNHSGYAYLFPLKITLVITIGFPIKSHFDMNLISDVMQFTKMKIFDDKNPNWNFLENTLCLYDLK